MIRGTGAETWDVPPSDEEYTLEEILAEYGSSRQQKILEEVDRELQPETAEEYRSCCRRASNLFCA